MHEDLEYMVPKIAIFNHNKIKIMVTNVSKIRILVFCDASQRFELNSSQN